MKKNNNRTNNNTLKNPNEDDKKLITKEELETYGQVLNPLGNNRMLVKCFDGKERICTIRGSMRKKIWISKNDIVLVSLREFQDDKADIIYKYDNSEVRKLKILDELKIDDKNKEENEENFFDFDEI